MRERIHTGQSVVSRWKMYKCVHLVSYFYNRCNKFQFVLRWNQFGADYSNKDHSMFKIIFQMKIFELRIEAENLAFCRNNPQKVWKTKLCLIDFVFTLSGSKWSFSLVCDYLSIFYYILEPKNLSYFIKFSSSF